MSQPDPSPIAARVLERAAEALHRDPDLLSGLDGGGWVAEFEDAFSAWIGTPHVLATSNATGALIAALVALGIGPGDEVVMPSYAWVGCAGAIRLVGAEPVWADIDPETFQVDPASVVRSLTPRTRALVAVHVCGHPCAVDELAAIAQAYGLPLIEDAAQALGASVAGLRVGRWGDFAIFSFGPGKLIEAGEGGVLVARTPMLHQRALMVSQHPLRQGIEVTDPQLLGSVAGATTLNFRIHPLAALIARERLTQIEDELGALRNQYPLLREELAEFGDVRLPRVPQQCHPSGAVLPLHLQGESDLPSAGHLSAWLAKRGHSLHRGPIGVPCHLRPGFTPHRNEPGSSWHVNRLEYTEWRCAGGEFFVRLSRELRD